MGRVRLIAKKFTFGLRNEPERLFGFATVRPSITEAALKRKVSADCLLKPTQVTYLDMGRAEKKALRVDDQVVSLLAASSLYAGQHSFYLNFPLLCA